MGRLNRIAKILMTAGGTLTLASFAINGARVSLLPLVPLGVAIIGGILIFVDGELKKRRER